MTSAPDKLLKRLRAVPREDGPAISPRCLSIDSHSSSLNPQSISFLQLPREIRDLIYAEILATPKGIQFSPYAIHPHGPPRRYHLKGKDASLAESERQASDAWLPTTILRVNRQVAAEAAETLYGKNAFIFRPPLDHAVQFLSALPPQRLQSIRHLTLQKRLFMPLHFDNTQAWTKLYLIISRHMALHSVIIFPPLEPSMYDPATTATPAWRFRTLLADDTHQFWWPSVKFFASLLMSPHHPLKKIRLVWPGFEDKGLAYPPRVKADLDVEALAVIKILRVPQRQGDELVENEILRSLKESGQHGAFTKRVWSDWHQKLEAREMERHKFVVKREETGEGGGVVLSLTPPASIVGAKIGWGRGRRGGDGLGGSCGGRQGLGVRSCPFP